MCITNTSACWPTFHIGSFHLPLQLRPLVSHEMPAVKPVGLEHPIWWHSCFREEQLEIHRIVSEINNFLSNIDFLTQLWLVPKECPGLNASGPGMMTGQNSQRTQVPLLLNYSRAGYNTCGLTGTWSSEGSTGACRISLFSLLHRIAGWDLRSPRVLCRLGASGRDAGHCTGTISLSSGRVK